MMPELPPSDTTLATAVRKFVTRQDVRMKSNELSVRGGIGERTTAMIQAILKYGRETLEGKTLFGGRDYIDEERCARQMILDFINGRMIPYLSKEPGEDVNKFIKRTGKECFNFVDLILQIKCQLYKDAPDRRFLDEDDEEAGGEDELRKVKQIYRRGGFNASMRDIDRYCHAFGYCLARWVRKPLPSKKEDDFYWKLAVIPPTDFDYMLETVEGEVFESVTAVVFRSLIEKSGIPNISKAAYRHEVWTKDHYAEYVDGKLVRVEENIYGRIPYVYCTQTGNEAERFRQPDMLESVISNSEVNRMMSLSNWAMTFAGMPVTVFTDNKNGEADMSAAPGTIIDLESMIDGQTATFEFKAPQDRTQSFVLHLRSEITALMHSNGITAYSPDGLKAGTSGVAVEVSMAPVVSYLKQRAQVDQVIETDLYHLLKDTVEAEVSESLPEAAYVEVEYPFEMSLQSAEERRKSVEFKLKHGLITKARALRVLEPERYASDSEAEDALPEEKEPTAGFGDTGELGEEDGNIDADGNPIGERGVTGDDNPRNEGTERPPVAGQRNQEQDD